MPHHGFHADPLFIALFILMAYIVWMLVTGVRAMSRSTGSYLVWEQGRTMEFRLPDGDRRALRMAAVLFALMSVVFLLMARRAANPLPVYSLGLPDGLLLIALFAYLSGPNDVRLDGERRVYERTFGWPWQPRTRSGTFEDITGLSVSPRGNVVLLMRRRELIRAGVVLGGGAGRGAATALAEKVSCTTGLPLVGYAQARR